MTIRIVVAGCRDFNRYDVAKPFLDKCLCDLRNEYNIILVSGEQRVQMLRENVMQGRIILKSNGTLLSGKNMERVQGRYETRKWQKLVTSLFAFGMKKVRVQKQ